MGRNKNFIRQMSVLCTQDLEMQLMLSISTMNLKHKVPWQPHLMIGKKQSHDL